MQIHLCRQTLSFIEQNQALVKVTCLSDEQAAKDRLGIRVKARVMEILEIIASKIGGIQRASQCRGVFMGDIQVCER